ncbi:hypothetical protein LMG33818_002630 [Halomonadaceae bacterium LMG 33818]|uniref:hypothetical protein n=1 Tax=Cernens ardua TaxID=3402176 RepID=UPI003EDC0D25
MEEQANANAQNAQEESHDSGEQHEAVATPEDSATLMGYTEEQVQEKINAGIEKALSNVCSIVELAADKFTRETFDDAAAFVKKHC